MVAVVPHQMQKLIAWKFHVAALFDAGDDHHLGLMYSGSRS